MFNTTGNTSQETMASGEITLKDLILKIKGFVSYLIGKWLIIGLVGIAGAGAGVLFAFFSNPKYTGEMTFIMEEPKGGGLSAYAGIASQFGIDLGGMSGGSGLFSGDNILGFLKSRLMVEKALLYPFDSTHPKKSLADEYIEAYKLHDKWSSKPGLKDIQLPANSDRKKFTPVQDSIMNVLYNQLLKENLDISKPDKKVNIISAKCTSRSELFSLLFVQGLVREAIDFYVTTRTQRSKATVDRLQAKADSVEFLLNRKSYAAAAQQDLNMNPARRVASVPTEVFTRDKMVLQTIYGEVVKNLEMSKMAMSQETPIIQIIDIPNRPLEKVKTGKAKSLIIGGIVGAMLAIAFLTVRRMLQEIMK
ncbi:lipopolysaccharide biosynthesis protein [Chitinophaga sp. Cy-1792]|uniref:lipopolysaccharide biosynthesis protein n=1 Tax=Chitinophaga sp. Cy-1792 TaxID=2608339 RepID=UPI001422F91B|nr:lipopolysaccharide biosynthesis protein [Chitinophaga sp. Cy-1792]NIG52096.1 lipopolysaccharide biosynthesis protein [Chitinophaga sp. Cy-1792]